MDSRSAPPEDDAGASRPGGERVREAIIKLAEPIAAVHKCEVVEIEYRREPVGWVVRLFVEKLGHDPRNRVGGVTLEECVRVSRDLSMALDVGEVIAHQYHLEVSSPGLERPLVKREDWARFVGLRAKIHLALALDDQPNRRAYRGEILGVRDEASGAVISIREEDLGEVGIPLERIGKASLVAEPFKKAEKPGKGPKHARKAQRAS